ncbi:SulP family inorganic anion transporter [Alkalicoccobacillus murimartini]|uniref:SulP family sulfate permease n=1 Tax=Alkalicoccobacillus murimartini TaxID=171685 RepID=A0ABT9YMX2_9BACI|nr:SulP family inorganic anion transporter [Alkalicoccobacillus murimartini]MDQ0208846.1 SulP family sulfate permease [Alkalicoccobacillus murimartini]
MIESFKEQWLSNVRGDILSGIVVALALIPEAIAFSIIAGVDPMVGLYASFCIAVVIAFVGGRPGMISAATGAMALVMVTLVANYGLEYLLAATILTGVIQIIFGVCKFAKLMQFVPRTVMTGFVNSLAILIFMAQIEHFIGETWVMYLLVGVTLAIIYLFPMITKAVPSTLVAIIVVTIIVLFLNIGVRNVGDMGTLTQTLPSFVLPNVPFNLETLWIILPYSFALAIVGLLESLLTASIVDDMTDTASNKNKESRGQGIANIVSGFFGGMAGCAMIGQSVINVKSGGRGRLSTLVAGVFLMFLIVVLGSLVVRIPMAALAGVMIMVSVSTFDWNSVRTIHRLPRTDAIVLVVTIAVVLVTHNLAYGVLSGVVLSMIFFAAKISKIHVSSSYMENQKKRIYKVEGPLFFASVTRFLSQFDTTEKLNTVDIDFTHSQIWDDSAVGALDRLESLFTTNGIEVQYIGLNQKSMSLLKSLGKIPNA